MNPSTHTQSGISARLIRFQPLALIRYRLVNRHLKAAAPPRQAAQGYLVLSVCGFRSWLFSLAWIFPAWPLPLPFVQPAVVSGPVFLQPVVVLNRI
jgi:hypothetical protein